MKVHVVGNGGATETLFKSKGFEIERNLENSDILVFTGGQDINPALYGEKVRKGTYFSMERDQFEIEAYQKGKKKLKIGICRGAQLLNVLNGGSMYQHITNHTSKKHAIYTPITRTLIGSVNSLHHQMMLPSPSARIFAVASESTERHSYSRSFISSPFENDYEILGYINPEEGDSYCFQGHPEFGDVETTDIFFKVLQNFQPEVANFMKGLS